MSKTVKAKVINGVLTPLEPLDLPEGAVYRLTLDVDYFLESGTDAPETEKIAHPVKPDWREAIGAWQDDNGYWEKFLNNLYASRAAGSREPVDP